MRQKSHNFRFVLASRDIHKKKDANVSIYLEYRHGLTRTRPSTKVKVPKGSWNAKKSSIDLKAYPHLIKAQQRLDEIKSKTYDQVQLLNKGKVTYTTAIEEILSLMPDESLLAYYDEWYKKNKAVDYSTYNQRRGVIIAIQNKMKKLGKKEYVELKFEHFADSSSLERIASIIKNEFGLSPNGSYGYLKRLDEFYNKKYNRVSPFKTKGLRGSYDDPELTGVSFRDMLAGQGRIKTLQDLEAYLFFLYSLCLRGLNGKDIFRMRDEDFVGVEDEHYIPNSTSQPHKQHYLKVRGKKKKQTKKKMKIISNLYPTMQIRKWLQWIVEIERPNLCKTEEEYAIYRKFSDAETTKHWSSNLRTRYSENLKNIFGKGINSARHTYTQNGLKLGVGWGKLQSSLGQKPTALKGKSILNYARTLEDELDLIQVDILDKCQIITLYFELCMFLKDRKPFRGKRQTFFPKWFKEEHNAFAYMRSEQLALSGWTYQDEYKLQNLEELYGDLEYIKGVQAGDIKVTPQEGGGLLYEGTLGKNYGTPVPKELQELREKKDRIEKEKYQRELEQLKSISNSP